jgi:excisionase family DNA binding protein
MPVLEINKIMTITEVARQVGISSKTIVRWEKVNKISKAKRNWRNWRIYNENDIKEIKVFFETIF